MNYIKKIGYLACWLFSCSTLATLLVLGMVYEIEGCLNVGLTYAWFIIILSLFDVTDRSIARLVKDNRFPAAPNWLDVGFDLSIIGLLSVYSHWITVLGYSLHLLVYQYTRQTVLERRKVPPPPPPLPGAPHTPSLCLKPHSVSPPSIIPQHDMALRGLAGVLLCVMIILLNHQADVYYGTNLVCCWPRMFISILCGTALIFIIWLYRWRRFYFWCYVAGILGMLVYDALCLYVHL